jgi:hypothetical protein
VIDLFSKKKKYEEQKFGAAIPIWNPMLPLSE